jgi:uncharacterized protein YecT (DUF1311 family)
MRSTFAITSIVAAVFAVGMCAAWPALPRDATKVPPPSATPPQPQPQTASERRWQAATTQREMNAAASADESDARARMERALKEVRDHASTLGAQGSTVLALVDRSQRAWKAYFDAEVELRWPPNAEDFGTIYPMCVATDRARMCNERARALESLVHVEEGEVCGPRWDERKAEVGERALTQPAVKSSK